MKEERKRVVIFYRNFRYEGYLLEEDDIVYVLEDFKEGIVKLPRSNSVLKEVSE